MNRRNSQSLRRGRDHIEFAINDGYTGRCHWPVSLVVPESSLRLPTFNSGDIEKRNTWLFLTRLFWERTHRTLPKATRQRQIMAICVPSPVIHPSINFEINPCKTKLRLKPEIKPSYLLALKCGSLRRV